MKEGEHYDFLTHLDKPYWEEENILKRDLINYYQTIAPFILPHLKDRPESLKRFPHGSRGESFFQKNLETHPDWVKTVPIEHTNKTVHYLIINDLKTLLYAVNLGCIEMHPWFSRTKTLHFPDFIILDLDPEEIDFDAVIQTALLIHEILEKIKIPHFCKTSGARGIHIAIPLSAHTPYEKSKEFAHLLAIYANKQLPLITSLERSPKKRQHKVYIDYLQNNFGQTLASVYSVRAKPGAPVSTPLEWNELKKGIKPTDYTLFTTPKRLKLKGDLFKPVLGRGINLSRALKNLQSLCDQE